MISRSPSGLEGAPQHGHEPGRACAHVGIPAIQDLIPRALATNLSGLRCFSMPAKHDGEGAPPRDPSPSSFSLCSPSPPSYRSIAMLTIAMGLAARLASMPIDRLARRWGAEEKDIEQEVRATPPGDQLPGAPTTGWPA